MKATAMPDGPRYEDDFYAWTQYQAEVLRSLHVSDNRFDREHVAEEIEYLGKSERNAPFSLDEICQQDWYPVSPETEVK
jgi:hypothetical protein